MSTAAQQNALMLASILGTGEEEASERLKRVVEDEWRVGNRYNLLAQRRVDDIDENLTLPIDRKRELGLVDQDDFVFWIKVELGEERNHLLFARRK